LRCSRQGTEFCEQCVSLKCAKHHFMGWAVLVTVLVSLSIFFVAVAWNAYKFTCHFLWIVIAWPVDIGFSA
jgi:hypothetical protein